MIKWLFTALVLSLAQFVQAQLNLELLAHVPNDSGVTLAGCWHYVGDNGSEYALVGTRKGLDIYDVSIPTQPVRKYQVPGLDNNWREVKVWNKHAYVGSEAQGSGITIVDLSQIEDSIRWKVWYGDGLLSDQIQRSHTVGAVDGYLYVYGSTAPNNGAIICSLQDPWNPAVVGNYTTNYLHDGFVRGDTLWGSEIYQGQFSVVDITDRSNPVLITSHPTPAAFNHNTELSHSGAYLFTTDEKAFAPLASFKVDDLDNIQLADVYFPSQKPSFEVHNVRVYGEDYLVCPSYGGQLTIVDASDPTNLIETAWAVVGTSLVWDADPYLPSGIVFASAKAEGFFIFKPTYTRAARLRGRVTNALTGSPIDGAKVVLLNTPNADTTQMNGNYATGAAATGTYTLMAVKSGFDTLFTTVSLQSGQTDTIDLALQPRASSTNTSVFSSIRIYPTVVLDGFTIEMEATLTNCRTQLLGLEQGRVMLEQVLDGPLTHISVKDLPVGVYAVLVEGQVVGKVMVVDK
jgi:choice-of-anchor B domain-containing protein